MGQTKHTYRPDLVHRLLVWDQASEETGRLKFLPVLPDGPLPRLLHSRWPLPGTPSTPVRPVSVHLQTSPRTQFPQRGRPTPGPVMWPCQHAHHPHTCHRWITPLILSSLLYCKPHKSGMGSGPFKAVYPAPQTWPDMEETLKSVLPDDGRDRQTDG